MSGESMNTKRENTESRQRADREHTESTKRKEKAASDGIGVKE
jgi:hypothetical protein